MRVLLTDIWIKNACTWQPAPSALSTKDLPINVATLVARLPKVAKKAKRLMGFRNLLEKQKVKMMKKQPSSEKTEQTRSIMLKVSWLPAW